MKSRKCKVGLIAVFLALGAAEVFSGEADNDPPTSGNSPTLQSMVPQPQVYRIALLEKLDLVQQEIDAARIKLKQTSAGDSAYTQLDIAQQLLDQARERLEGEATTPNQAATRNYLIELLHNARRGLDAARQRVAGQPGSESTIAALDATQKNLDNTKRWLQEPGKDSPPGISGSAGLQAMYDKAQLMLDELRAKIMSAPEVDPQALAQLEAAERKLDEARLQSQVLGLLD